MPRPLVEQAAHYRLRAGELRALAEDLGHAESREALLRLAADYDKLADYAEERAAARPKAN